MSDIDLTIGYPVTALYVPRRGSTVVGDFVRREAHVTLRRACNEAFEPLGDKSPYVKGVEWLYRAEGAFWTAFRKGAGPGQRGPDDFVDWLTNPGRKRRLDFTDILGGTPLLAACTSLFNPVGTRGTAIGGLGNWGESRGEDIDPLPDAREVLFDGTDAARARVVRFVGEEIRITQDTVFRKVQPLVQLATVGRNGSRGIVGYITRANARLWDDKSLPVHPAMAEAAARRWCEARDLNPAAWIEVGERLGDVPPHDADLETLARDLPGAVLDMLRQGPGQASDPRLWEAARARTDSLRVAAFEGLVGGNADLEREPLFKEILAAIDAVTQAYPDKRASRFLRMSYHYIQEDVLPRIRRSTREIEPSDADALGMLAP